MSIDMFAEAIELRALQLERGLPRPPDGAVRVVEGGYLPWGKDGQACTQKHFYRSAETCRVVVAGRQSGKTQAAAADLIDVMLWTPGSFSVLLAPTFSIARAAIRKVLELCDKVPGFRANWWKEQKKELHFPNGSVWDVFSADRKESVRGPSVTGLFWVDEGAFLKKDKWEAALGALGAAPDARIVVTTTPVGKNWVYAEFTDEDNQSFRFRTEDSPFCNRKLVGKLRKKMSKEMAQQEFDAVFVDNLLLAFPDQAQLWVDGFPPREESKLQNALGIDLGKEQDFVVVTLMNQWGEARALGRWQRLAWPKTVERIVAMAKQHRALCVVDMGAGGGYGGVLADYLEAEKLATMRIRTAHVGTKAQIVEQARADVQWGRIKLKRNEYHEQFSHELSTFQGIKRVSRGQEIMIYEGPQIPGEHDDCVISLCLANWGRVHGEHADDPLSGDLSGFVGDDFSLAGEGFGSVVGGGYLMRRVA